MERRPKEKNYLFLFGIDFAGSFSPRQPPQPQRNSSDRTVTTLGGTMKKLLTVLLASLMMAGMSFWVAPPVIAQENDAAIEAGTVAEDVEGDESTFMLEEITVTAEKSEMNLQKISRSMAVLSSEELREKSNNDFLEALDSMGLNFMGGNNQHLYIRGIGHTTAEEGSEPGVQFNVDGAPSLLIEGATISPMYQVSNDIERVEVIRGPSGSVNGRSAAAGTVNVITRSPDFEKVDGNVGVTVGNYQTVRLNAAINLPMKLTGLDLPSFLENLSLRIAAAENKHEAYVYNGDGEGVSGMQDNFSIRYKLKWQPIEPLTINAALNYQRDASNMMMNVPPIEKGDSAHPHDPWMNEGGAELGDQNVNRQYMENLEITYETGIGTITGRYGYSWVPVTCQASDQNCYEGKRGQKDYELRLNSPADSRITWNFGGYFFNKQTYTGPDQMLGQVDPDNTNIRFIDFYGENTFNNAEIFDINSPNPQFNPNQQGIDGTQPWDAYFNSIYYADLVPGNSSVFVSSSADRPIDSYSAFANATIPLFEDRHRLVVGLRKNFERKKRETSVGIFMPQNDPEADDYWNGYPHFTFVANDNDPNRGEWICDNCYLVDTQGPETLETDDDPISYTLGWEYDWRDDVMLYAQVSNGYKPGGISPHSVPNVYYDPEYLINYAVGTKSRWFDQRVQLNSEIFLMDYDGYQTNLAADNAAINYTLNGATYTMYRKFQSKTVNFPRTYIYGFDLDYDWLITPMDRLSGNMEYKVADYPDFQYYLGKSDFPPGKPEVADFSGRRMPFAPRFTWNGNYSHIFNIDNLQVTPRLSAKYSSGYLLYTEWWWQSTQPELWQPEYWTFDAYMNIGPQDGTWSLNLYYKNITEEPVRLMAMMEVQINEPMTYGATFQVRF